MQHAWWIVLSVILVHLLHKPAHPLASNVSIFACKKISWNSLIRHASIVITNPSTKVFESPLVATLGICWYDSFCRLLNLLARSRQKTLLNRLSIFSKTQTKSLLVSQSSISQLVAHLFFPTWLSLADDDWVMKNSVIPRSKSGSWRKVLYFLENCWRNNGTENHHPCFSSASMIQIAVLDTHSNTMATVQNRDVTQQQFSY